ncbi:LysR family transcriptional regulator [Rhizobiales bacterium]|uniref:LysR substrate-binding domain-containing protein n=1 Tax=Hongsoonwoonella zoysiae TaxID=2821844 RepID=UPI00155FE0ED|nr:LysR substrate-binding domain-containing protein [Hongsoonwoonella zoysiae]NRG19683.1 LysR family transcriptional regulator [Hongsoonwoonella zoysiae]
MQTLPLNMLRAFAAVYETGGVRSAARMLGVTHSAVSRLVRDLEAWIDTPIIERNKGQRLIRFTAAGEALGRDLVKSFSGIEEAIRSIREIHPPNAVTIETTPSFAARWLLPRLGDFEAEYPWIELSIIVDQRIGDPGERGADLAIRMGGGRSANPAGEPLMDDALYPVMSPSCWRALGMPSDISTLARGKLLHDRDPSASWAMWKERFGPDQLDVRAGPRFSSSDLVLRAAEQGLGIALARHRLVGDALATGALIRPFRDLALNLPAGIRMVFAQERRDRLAVGKTIGWLRAQAAEG